ARRFDSDERLRGPEHVGSRTVLKYPQGERLRRGERPARVSTAALRACGEDGRTNRRAITCPLCPCRIAVRSLGSQSRDGGSTPPRETGRAGATGLPSPKGRGREVPHPSCTTRSPLPHRQRAGVGRLPYL